MAPGYPCACTRNLPTHVCGDAERVSHVGRARGSGSRPEDLRRHIGTAGPPDHPSSGGLTVPAPALGHTRTMEPLAGDARIWEIRCPEGGTAGSEFARATLGAEVSSVLVHAPPDSIDVEVRGPDRTVVARSAGLRAGAS